MLISCLDPQIKEERQLISDGFLYNKLQEQKPELFHDKLKGVESKDKYIYNINNLKTVNHRPNSLLLFSRIESCPKKKHLI